MSGKGQVAEVPLPVEGVSNEQFLLARAASLLQALPQPYLTALAGKEALGAGQLLEIAQQRTVERFFKDWRNFRDAKLGGRGLVEMLESLLEFVPRTQLREIALGMFATEFHNGLMAQLWPVAGLDNAIKSVHCPKARFLHDLQHQGIPAILTFWHLGPIFCLAPVLARIGVPALILARPRDTISTADLEVFAAARVEYLVVSDSPSSRVMGLKRCVEHLQKGGFVCVGADGTQGERKIEAPFLGRRLAVGSAPALLARLTGAPVIPVVWAWAREGWAIDFDIFDPIGLPEVATQDSDAFAQALTREIVQRFDTYVRSHPDQLRVHRIHHLLTAPHLAQSTESSVN